MKRFLVIALALLAFPATAAVTYNFETVTTGLRQGTLAGAVAVDGAKLRMDISTGDNFLFKNNSLVLSNDGGNTLTVVDPTARTYYVIKLNDLIGSSTSMLSGVGGMFKLNFVNPRVSVRNLGAGPAVEGYPTQRSVVDASYDISFDAMGTKMTMNMAMTTESWSTDRLGSEFINFLQLKNLRTGFEQLDKLIDAQSGAIKGRFPLKQVTTVQVKQGNSDVKSVSTSTVTRIQKKDIAAPFFTMPSGFAKVDDPITRMMKNLK